MSYTSSNLYASRVFSEHPLALWAMDEESYFVSLLSENEKSISDSDWNIINGVSSASAFTITGYPFDNEDVNKIYLETDVPKSMSASLISSINSSELDKNKGSICFSTFIYIPETTLLKDVYVGFIINGEQRYKKYSLTSLTTGVNSLLKFNTWEKITFTLDTSLSDEFIPFIKIDIPLDLEYVPTPKYQIFAAHEEVVDKTECYCYKYFENFERSMITTINTLES
jgi:hypothetical protein